MITNLRISNFKSLKDISLDLRNINLFMGLNGMGKSSLIQALLLLRQSRDLVHGTVNLNDSLTNIGTGKDAMYQYNDKDEYIQIQFSDNLLPELEWKLEYQPENQHLTTKDIYAADILGKHSLFNSNFQYLKAERTPPLDDYKTSSQEVVKDKQIGIEGQFAVHYLNEFGNDKVSDHLLHPKGKTNLLLHQVDAWLGEISPGTKLNTREVPGLEKILLDFQFETATGFTNNFKPKNVGFGLTYVLPVILSLLVSVENRLIIIENPESHIHPRGQAELGKLIALAALTDAQVLIETHSDHIINGMRVAVKEKNELVDKVHLYFFERRTT